MGLRYTLGLLMLFINLRLVGQPAEAFRTELLGTKDGLSHRWTLCVHQDAKGFIWVGTYDGLNRYDGHEFTVYRPSANGKFPVKADFIFQIAETADGKFYLSTEYGILHFDPILAQFELLLKFEVNKSEIVLIDGTNTSFVQTNIESFGMENVPLNIYKLLPSGELSLLSKLPPFPENSNNLTLVECSEEAAWFWDFKGKYHRYGLNNKAWSSFPVTGSKAVPLDLAGNFWLPDGERLNAVSLPESMRYMNWSTFHIEQGKAVWLYAEDGKDVYTLYRFDLKSVDVQGVFPSLNDESFVNYRTGQPFRPSHYLDTEGTVWFAGFAGLYKVRSTGRLFRHYLSKPVVRMEAPPSGTSARQLAEDHEGNIYLRDAANNFHIINPESGTTEKISLPMQEDGLPQNAMRGKNGVPATDYTSMLGGRDGSIWFSSANGIFNYDPAGKQYRRYQVPPKISPFILTDLGDRILWGITPRENYFLNKKTGKSELISSFNFDELQTPVFIPDENILWGFTDTGLVKINLLTLDATYIRLYEEPREQRCLVAHRGWLWLGTSRGLEKVDPATFARTSFDRSKGLPGKFVYCIVADGDYLWLGTSEGLCRFHVETGTVKNYYVEDGLSHNEFNTLSALKARNGKIYMGGLNGVNAFFPTDLEKKTNAKTRTLLSRYTIFDTKNDSLLSFDISSLPASIELHPSTTSLNLHLSLSSYLDPVNNQYAWRMDGLDEDWYYAGNQHVAMYPRLPPGQYTFRAKAADPFGNWTENELALRIIVHPPGINGGGPG